MPYCGNLLSNIWVLVWSFMRVTSRMFCRTDLVTETNHLLVSGGVYTVLSKGGGSQSDGTKEASCEIKLYYKSVQ